MSNAEELLGLEAGSLFTLILKRPDDRIGKASGSLVENKPSEAKVVLDALSRIIYGRTYKFCLQQCSMQSFPTADAWQADCSRLGVSGGKSAFTSIHFLDMPGWEQLDPSIIGECNE